MTPPLTPAQMDKAELATELVATQAALRLVTGLLRDALAAPSTARPVLQSGSLEQKFHEWAEDLLLLTFPDLPPEQSDLLAGYLQEAANRLASRVLADLRLLT